MFLIGSLQSCRVLDQMHCDIESRNESDSESEHKANISRLHSGREYQARLKVAWNAVESTHSPQDLTSFIALFYFALRTDHPRLNEQNVMNIVDRTFQLNAEHVRHHLDVFSELWTKSKNCKRRKKRKRNW